MPPRCLRAADNITVDGNSMLWLRCAAPLMPCRHDVSLLRLRHADIYAELLRALLSLALRQRGAYARECDDMSAFTCVVTHECVMLRSER